MLKIVLLDKIFYDRGAVFLTETAKVEREFLQVLNNDREAFRDAVSLALMEAIDSAKRQGDYGVVTPFGESCISCLSTGCKFGLLVLFFRSMKQVKLITEFGAAGSNVWEWLAKNVNVQVYMCKENVYLGMMKLDHMKFICEGRLYDPNSRELNNSIWAAQCAPYTMTRERENQAYEWRGKTREIHCLLKEEQPLVDFVQRFPDGASYFDCDRYELEDMLDMLKKFKVTNYCSYIPVEFEYRRHPLYVCGIGADGVQYQQVNSVKYPQFMELLFYDVLEGTWQYEKNKEFTYSETWYGNIFDSWFVLVVNHNESCEVREYPQKSLFGIEVKWKEKQIVIYDKKQAVDYFHKLYNLIEN